MDRSPRLLVAVTSVAVAAVSMAMPSVAADAAAPSAAVAIKAKYHLWVTTTEKNAITRIITICPGQRIPTR
jgi:hypothetical protein